MKNKICTGVVLAGLAGMHGASAADSIGEALKETKPILNWRVRFEGVDQTGVTEEADALTSRVRAGFQTGSVGGWSLLGEAVWTEDVVDDFNDTLNGQTQYPVVADPGGFATVNRFAFTNKSLENTTLTIGRQRIVLDDARFVGNVGWRQNEQTYDGIRAQIDTEGVNIDLSYITQVNRIFGPDHPAGKWNGDIMLANVSKTFGIGKLTGFIYSLDIDEAAALSSSTIGFRFNGSKPIGDGGMSALYTLSYADQSDTGNNPANFSEAYYRIQGGIGIDKFTISAGIESLGSDGTSRVTMPLATLHAFQGWTDKFLATPAAGIDDQFLRFTYNAGEVGIFDSLNVLSVLHDYETNVGSTGLGDEFELQVVGRKGPIAVTLKYASFSADTVFTDTDKFWLMMDYAF